jgi:Ca-activated chloride channel family protein
MAVKFLQPGMVIWFLSVPVIVSLCLLQLRTKNAFRDGAGFGSTLRSISRLSSFRRDAGILLAAVIASSALVLALMRPQIYVEILLPEYEKQDLVVLLDRSVSMYANDILPSRFDRAIDEIKTFLIEKPDEIDRVAIIGFAGTSITLSYLTRDIDALFFFLDWIREDTQIYYGTNMTEALKAGHELVQKDKQATRKLFLILSDGDDQGVELATLLNELRQDNIRVHTIGIGSEYAVPIPLSRGSDESHHLEDEQGEPLITLLNEASLRMIASTTTGSFFRSVTGRELASTIKQILLDDRQQTGWQSLQDYRDIHLPFLILSFVTTFFLILRI